MPADTEKLIALAEWCEARAKAHDEIRPFQGSSTMRIEVGREATRFSCLARLCRAVVETPAKRWLCVTCYRLWDEKPADCDRDEWHSRDDAEYGDDNVRLRCSGLIVDLIDRAALMAAVEAPNGQG